MAQGEVMKLIKYVNKNYGWPIASYGEKYSSYNSKTYYSHHTYGFEEPIFAYVPSIGISEIIKLPNEFSEPFRIIYYLLWLKDIYIE